MAAVNALLEQAKTTGVPLRGSGPEVVMGTTFTGLQTESGAHGFFSYDGIHPSDVGHAILANEMLTVAKERLSDKPRFAQLTSAPLLDEKAIHADDPRTRPVLILK